MLQESFNRVRKSLKEESLQEDLSQYGIVELRDGLTKEMIEKMDNDVWLFNSKNKMKNVVLGVKKGLLQWYSGEWIKGHFASNSETADVVWHDGVFNGGIWQNGFFLGGNFKGGTFVAGEFKGGTFTNGFFEMGEFNGGNWIDGEWDEDNAVWKKGKIKGKVSKNPPTNEE